jgi:hypothetical protein
MQTRSGAIGLVGSLAEPGSESSRLVGVQEHPGYEISVRGCD